MIPMMLTGSQMDHNLILSIFSSAKKQQYRMCVYTQTIRLMKVTPQTGIKEIFVTYCYKRYFQP